MTAVNVVSIIICTCNRAEDLRQTLCALARVEVPETLTAELIVVDNASTDATKQVVCAAHPSNMPVRYVYEPRRGKGHAYNTGMAHAQGDIFLFTDDDVRPPADWIAGMCRPILSGQAQAVAGGVHLAPHLLRDWMQPIHRGWLASTEFIAAQTEPVMVGANMAFEKQVLGQVPAFDTELGPGALGFGDEVLLSRQLHQCGHKIMALPDVTVEHHCDPARLSRQSYLNAAVKHGRTAAYIAYHWEHQEIANPRLAVVKCRLRLLHGRRTQRRGDMQQEGLPLWELYKLQGLHFYKQFLVEQRRPRNYEKQGLTKIAHE